MTTRAFPQTCLPGSRSLAQSRNSAGPRLGQKRNHRTADATEKSGYPFSEAEASLTGARPLGRFNFRLNDWPPLCGKLGSIWTVKRPQDLLLPHNSILPRRESQRDSDPKPRVARHELPWENVRRRSQPQRGCAQRHPCAPDENGMAATALRLGNSFHDDPR